MGISHATLRLGAVVAALTAAIGLSFWLLRDSSWAMLLGDIDALHREVARLGWLGPLAVIGFMALAIVVSPLPRAPIAVAAGAAFGQVWGTLYVVIGAELGAIIAFFISLSVVGTFGTDVVVI